MIKPIQFNLESHNVVLKSQNRAQSARYNSNFEHWLADQAYSIEEKDWNHGDAC